MRKTREKDPKKDTLRQGVKDFHFHLPESHFEILFSAEASLFLARDSINSKPLPYRPRKGETRRATKASRGWDDEETTRKICYPFDEISRRDESFNMGRGSPALMDRATKGIKI